MRDKKFIVLVVVIIALLLAGLIYFLFIYDPGATDKEKPREAQENKVGGENEGRLSGEEKEEDEEPERQVITHEEEDEVAPRNKEDFNRTDLKNMASSFAERFGSYSNHSGFSNFKDLEMFMSDSMKSWTEDFMEEEKEQEGSSYYGITTKAISSEVVEFDPEEGSAEIKVATKRRESRETRDDSTTYTQDLNLEFTRANGSWKVNAAHWEE